MSSKRHQETKRNRGKRKPTAAAAAATAERAATASEANLNAEGNDKSGKGRHRKGKVTAPSAASSVVLPPLLVLVCGLPGSGKSTFAEEFASGGEANTSIGHKKKFTQWAIVSQDELGTQDICRKQLTKALRHNQPCILDRCNVHVKERRMWLNFVSAFAPRVVCVFMDSPKDICKERAKLRQTHATLSPENVDQVVDDFARGLLEPHVREGYVAVYRARSRDHIKQVVNLIQAGLISNIFDELAPTDADATLLDDAAASMLVSGEEPQESLNRIDAVK